MPKLLDTRLVGYDLADVATHNYTGALPGNVLKVAANGKSMELGPAPPSLNAELAKDASLERNGFSLAQSLCASWQDVTPGGPTPIFTSVNGIAYGMGRFIAVGQNGPNTPVIAAGNFSTGINSTGPDLTPPGMGWDQIPANSLSTLVIGGPLYGIIYADGKFVACGANGTILVSNNGYVWNKISTGVSARLLRVAYGPGIGYVFVGIENSDVTDRPGVTIFSKDLSTFNVLSTPALGKITSHGIDTAVPIYGVGYGNGVFVAVGGLVSNWAPDSIWDANAIFQMGSHHIATSTNGTTWTLRPTSPEKVDSSHYCVEYGNGRFFVGTNMPSNAYNANEPNIIFTDDLGINWVTTYPALVGPIANGNVQTISYGNGIMVAGDNAIQLSNDGLLWQKLTGTGNVIPSSYYTPAGAVTYNGSASAYGNGLFLVGNRTGHIIRSRSAIEVMATYAYVDSRDAATLASANSYTDAKVAAIPQGPKGDKGDTGIGLKGDKGDQGIPGVMSTTWNAVGSFIMAWVFVPGGGGEIPDPSGAMSRPSGYLVNGTNLNINFITSDPPSTDSPYNQYNSVTGTWRLCGAMGGGPVWTGVWNRVGLWQKISEP